MSLVRGYASSDDETSDMKRPRLLECVAPSVSELPVALSSALGPANPHEGAHQPSKNLISGFAEKQAFDDLTFTQQHRTFQTRGYAQDALGNWVGDMAAARRFHNTPVGLNKPTKQQIRKLKQSRQSKGQPGSENYKGPWASYNKQDDSSDDDGSASSSAEDRGTKDVNAQESGNEEEDQVIQESSEFHGVQETDSLGRTYMHVPRDQGVNLHRDPCEHEFFVPKKRVHTWTGHVGGVNAVRFFPRHGHVLLSCGNDSKIKLWDCFNKRELLRTFSGHSRPLRDIQFGPDGVQFVSGGHDGIVRLWDTETGQCLSRWKINDKTGNVGTNCIQYACAPTLICGAQDNRIVQFDVRSESLKPVHEYNQHLGPVSSLTLVEHGSRFMSTSEDKSIRIWDWRSEIAVKYIAESEQQMMPCAKVHPEGRFVALQSMDNRIVVLTASDRYKFNKRKVFTDLHCAGHASEPDFSPDGKCVMSGDSSGYLMFWDWKTASLKSRVRAHHGPIVCTAAHPQESSKVATAGADAAIHYWD